MENEVTKWKPEWREDKVMVSFLSVTQSYDIEKYEWKILGWVMLKAQSILETKYKFPEDLRNLKDLIRNVRYASFTYVDLFGCKEVEHQISIPLTYLMKYDKETERYVGYEEVKRALRKLAKQKEFENKAAIHKKEGIHEVWGIKQIISKVKITNISGNNWVRFCVSDEVWNLLLNFSKGVRSFEMTTYMQLSNPSSYIFYMLLSCYQHQEEIVRPVDVIRSYFDKQNQYKDFKDFKRRIIEPAQKELKEIAPFYFEPTYWVNYYPETGEVDTPAGKGRGKGAKYIKFKIIYQPNKNEKIDQRILEFKKRIKPDAANMEDLIEPEIKMLAMFGFNEENPLGGKSLFYVVRLKWYLNYGNIDSNWRNNQGKFFLTWLQEVHNTCLTHHISPENMKKYLIGAVKKKLEDFEPTTLTQRLEKIEF